MNKLVKSVSKADLNTEFLKSLNGILDLTDRELELLATFIAIDVNTPKPVSYTHLTLPTILLV